MIEFVIDVREDGAFRFQLLDGRQCITQAEVCGVRLKTKSVQDEDVQSGKDFLGAVRQAATVGNICGVVDLISQNGDIAVEDVDGCDLNPSQGKRLAVQGDHIEFGYPSAHRYFPVKDVTEVFLNGGQGQVVAVARDDGFIEKIKATQLINSVHMIGMMMRVQNPIDLCDIVLKALLAEVR